MLSYLLKDDTGTFGGVCENFEHVEKDGKHLVNLTGFNFERPRALSSDKGRWTFYAGGKSIFEVDLDELNAGR